MTVHRDVTAIDVTNSGNNRSTIQIFTPVLVQNDGILVGQHLDPLPNGHSLLQVLFFNGFDPSSGLRTLHDFPAFFQGFFIDTGFPGNFTGDLELFGFRFVEGVFQ